MPNTMIEDQIKKEVFPVALGKVSNNNIVPYVNRYFVLTRH